MMTSSSRLAASLSASPVVLVRKKDETLRFCVNYRQLTPANKRRLQAPRIYDTHDRLRHSRYFSSMNLKSGNWQMKFDERDREKTVVVTHDGLYLTTQQTTEPTKPS